VSDVQAALAAGASVCAGNNTGRTGLSLASERQDWNVAFEIIAYLLSKQCLPSVPDRGGYNALHIAAFYSSLEIVSLLLENHPTLVVKI
jgi:ankyrin repeat protein